MQRHYCKTSTSFQISFREFCCDFINYINTNYLSSCLVNNFNWVQWVFLNLYIYMESHTPLITLFFRLSHLLVSKSNSVIILVLMILIIFSFSPSTRELNKSQLLESCLPEWWVDYWKKFVELEFCVRLLERRFL